MKLGVGAFVTDRGLGICDLASQIEDSGLDSLFVCQNTHVPVSGAALLEGEHHGRDHHLLEPFLALGAALHGEFVDFAPILTGLRPLQHPPPPILIGRQGSRGIADTVEYADGRMPVVYPEFPAFLERYSALA